MLYFENDKMNGNPTIINLFEINSIKLMDLKKDEIQSKKFEIILPGRNYELKGSDVIEAREWVEFIELRIEILKIAKI